MERKKPGLYSLAAAIAASILPAMPGEMMVDMPRKHKPRHERTARQRQRWSSNKYSPLHGAGKPAGTTHNPSQINALFDRWNEARLQRQVVKADADPRSITSTKWRLGVHRATARLYVLRGGASA